MNIKNFIADLSQIYFNLKLNLKQFYQNSNFYDKKISKTKDIKSKNNMNFDIEIDGGINFDNCQSAIEAGANILVSGTTVFKSNNGDIKKNINLLKLK